MNVKNIKKRILSATIAGFLVSIVPIPGVANYSLVKAASQGTNNQEDECNAKLNVTSKSIVTNSTYTLKVYNLEDNESVTFKSDDTDIATVDKDGVISTNDKNGSTIITATVKSKSKTVKTLDCEIKVGPPAASIVLSKSDITLMEGKRYPFFENLVLIKPNTTVEVPVFSSSDTDVAVISSTGRITAKATGKTVITATLNNESSVSCTLTVVKDTKTK